MQVIYSHGNGYSLLVPSTPCEKRCFRFNIPLHLWSPAPEWEDQIPVIPSLSLAWRDASPTCSQPALHPELLSPLTPSIAGLPFVKRTHTHTHTDATWSTPVLPQPQRWAHVLLVYCDKRQASHEASVSTYTDVFIRRPQQRHILL